MSLRSKALATVLGVAMAGPLLFAAPGYAEGETNIDHVEVAEDGTVTALLAVDGIPAGQAPDLASVQVSVDGKPVQAKAETIQAGRIERTTVLALDASNSMKGPRFEAAKAAAKAYLDAAPDDVQVGLLTFSSTTHDVTEPTTDHASLSAAIDGITLTNGTAVYDALADAVELTGTEGSRSVLLLSDGKDQGKGSTLEEAITAATDQEVVVDVVSMDQQPKQLATMQAISDATGGQVIPADPAALAQIFADRAAALNRAMLVTFTPPAGDNTDASLEISLQAGGTTYSDQALVSLGDTSATEVKTVKPGSPLVGTMGLIIGGLVLLIGLATLVWFLLSSMSGGRSLAQRQIEMYTTGSGPGAAAVKKPSGPSLKETAVAMTENLVKGDFESKLTHRLNGAGSALTPAEWLLLHAGIAVFSAVIGYVFGGFPMLLMGLTMGLLMPWMYLKFRHNRRLTAFGGQLAETLQLMSGGLSAGLSMPQAIDTVVREGAEPMAGELRRALIEARLGIDMTDALEGIADRMESQDFEWVVMAIRIQREVGGNLAELLNTVADTLREREYLRRQVKVLSAEGRFSGYILGAMPIVMFIYLNFARPDFVEVLTTTFPGLMILAAAGVLLLIGFFMMSKIVKVKV